MGQTLSHGVYLPNEGERNCYAGLASNWQILNTAVGNIAEKAPLVHTHGNITNDGKVGTTANLPLITGTGGAVQAGSFGNTANTFCEGNDSRLSDARTPVAHTHGKADITDLFNSANTWTGDNIFNKPIQIQKTTGDTEIEIRNQQVDVTNNTASAVDDIRFFDKNGKITGGVRLAYDGTKVSQRVYARSYSSDGTSNTNVALELKSDLQNSIKEATISSDLLPATNNSYDLGSSSYQWNNLYAKQVNTQLVNGINPGALSLPDKSKAMGIDTTNFAYGSNFTFTPTVSGWLFVSVTNCTKASLKTGVGEYFFNQSSDHFRDTIPVIAGEQVTILLFSTATSKPVITLFPCLGNVPSGV